MQGNGARRPRNALQLMTALLSPVQMHVSTQRAGVVLKTVNGKSVMYWPVDMVKSVLKVRTGIPGQLSARASALSKAGTVLCVMHLTGTVCPFRRKRDRWTLCS